MDYSFLFGQPVFDEHYANRDLFTVNLLNHMSNLKSLILISPRGWGKRSFALHMGKLLSDQDHTIRTKYLDLNGVHSIEAFCKAYVQVFSYDYESFSYNPDTHLNHLDDLLNIPEFIATRDRIKHIIFIGQIEQIAGFENSLQFQKRLRRTWALQSQCAYFLFGNHLTVTKCLLDSPHKPFKKIGRCFKLPKIHLTELSEFIQCRFSQTGKLIPENVARSIANHSNCIPYYAQLLAWHTWIRTERVCSPKNVCRAMDQLTRQYDIHYQKVTNSLNENQINYLFAHLKGDHKLCSRYSLKEYNLKSSSRVSRLRTSLINKEILGSEFGDTFLLDPLYRNWLKKCYFGIP